MRYDTKVQFLKGEGEKVYDPDEGKYITTEPVTIDKPCHVHDLSTEKVVQIYGKSDVSAVSIHHQGNAVNAEKAKIKDKTYLITKTINLRNKASYIASEVTT